LDYTASHRHLLQAVRKAPQSPKTAGFQQAVSPLTSPSSLFFPVNLYSYDLIFFYGMLTGVTIKVNKLAVIVQLLTGEIPERSVFRQATLRKPLIPYLHITQGKSHVFFVFFLLYPFCAFDLSFIDMHFFSWKF
jgi:26S proteasome regulatory subunit N3